MDSFDQPIVFVKARTRLSNLERLLLCTFFLVIVGSIAWAVQWEEIDFSKLWAALSEKAPHKLLPLAPPFLFAMAQVLVLYAYRSALLIIDNEGIRLVQDSQSPIKKMALLSRRVRWADLEQVSFLSRFGILQLRPKGFTSVPWGIRVKEWELKDKFLNGDEQTKSSSASETDLVRVLREKGVFDAFRPNPNVAAAEFDLMAHPASKAALIVLAALGVYSILDGFASKESWAFFNLNYLLPHIVAGAAAALAAGFFLCMRKFERPLPSGIAWSLAIFLGFAFGFASYVGGIRINQLIGGPLIDHPYHRSSSCLMLVPENKNLPEIEYTKLAKDYLCSLDADKPIGVGIRQGLFGLYQVDLTKQTQAIRAYRDRH